jgi:hypothetical protein
MSAAVSAISLERCALAPCTCMVWTSQRSVTAARHLTAATSHIEFSVVDAMDLPQSPQYDVITALAVVHHMPLAPVPCVAFAMPSRQARGGRGVLDRQDPQEPLFLG